MERGFLPVQARLCTLAKLHQHKGNRTADFVPQKAQPLCFQPMLRGCRTQLRQPLRTVYQEKITAVAQCPCGSCKQRLKRTQAFLPGIGRSLAPGTAGKVRGIGNAHVKAARREKGGDGSQVGAYTCETVRNAVGAAVLQSGLMGSRIDLHPGDMAAGILCAQQYPQSAAAGSQIQHPGILWELGKMGQGHRVGTQRERPLTKLQCKTAQQMLHTGLLQN